MISQFLIDSILFFTPWLIWIIIAAGVWAIFIRLGKSQPKLPPKPSRFKN